MLTDKQIEKLAPLFPKGPPNGWDCPAIKWLYRILFEGDGSISQNGIEVSFWRDPRDNNQSWLVNVRGAFDMLAAVEGKVRRFATREEAVDYANVLLRRCCSSICDLNEDAQVKAELEYLKAKTAINTKIQESTDE